MRTGPQNSGKLKLFDGVYPPAEDSYLLLDCVMRRRSELGWTPADIGTGSGILAMEMARTGGLVLATDVNPTAAECAQRNAELNKLSQNIDVLCCDGLGAIRISKRFSAVVSNPPYLQQETAIQPKIEDQAWAGGELGTETLMLFVQQAVQHLEAAGSLWTVLSSSSGIEEPLRQMSRLGLRAQVVDRAELFFERLVVVRAAQPWAEDWPAGFRVTLMSGQRLITQPREQPRET